MTAGYDVVWQAVLDFCFSVVTFIKFESGPISCLWHSKPFDHGIILLLHTQYLLSSVVALCYTLGRTACRT